jgi:hypothetical protein
LENENILAHFSQRLDEMKEIDGRNHKRNVYQFKNSIISINEY